jgi:hypothetical protein
LESPGYVSAIVIYRYGSCAIRLYNHRVAKESLCFDCAVSRTVEPGAMLDLARVIDDLRRRKELIERAILQLEELRDQAGADIPKQRRGRKSMDPAERLLVSSRMKSYWEKRRKQ